MSRTMVLEAGTVMADNLSRVAANTIASQSPTGIEVIQVSDFYQRAGILHPITVGTIAIVALFVYLRLSSNRCVAPMTLFDWLLNVALGSTLAGIVNGTSLVRGLLALWTLMLFQLIASILSSHFSPTIAHILNSPPLVIAFRGTPLVKVMRKHRISMTDLNAALRRENVWHISEIECVIIEPTGTFSIYKKALKPDFITSGEYEADVLMDVPGYRALVEEFGDKGSGCEEDHRNQRVRTNDSRHEKSRGREEDRKDNRSLRSSSNGNSSGSDGSRTRGGDVDDRDPDLERGEGTKVDRGGRGQKSLKGGKQEPEGEDEQTANDIAADAA